MIANYKARFIPGLDESKAVRLNAKGERLAAQIWAEANRQFEIEKERITETVLASVMCVLIERYHFRGPVLTQIYKQAVELVTGWRFDLADGKRRLVGDQSEELVAMLMRLKDQGFDMRRLEAACQYDPDTGKITWKE